MMDLDAFMAMIKPELEAEVDRMIVGQPDLEDRFFLMQRRGEILRQYTAAVRAANVEHRVAAIERLIQTPGPPQ